MRPHIYETVASCKGDNDRRRIPAAGSRAAEADFELPTRDSFVGRAGRVIGFGMANTTRKGMPKGTSHSAHPRTETTAESGDPSGVMPQPRPRGRPRSCSADAAILRATFETLLDQGFRAFSMEAVAERARVSKATLYRRFPSKRELVASALRTIRDPRPAPDTGSFRDDLRGFVRREMARSTRVFQVGRLTARLLGDIVDEPGMLALLQETVMATDYAVLGEIVRRGIARGDLRADLDVRPATEILYGSLMFRFLISGGRQDPLSGREGSRLVDMLLKGLAAKPPGSRKSVRR